MAAHQQGGGSYWPRMILTYLIAIWAFIVLGCWLGQQAIEKYLSEDKVSIETSIEKSSATPWKHDASEQQKEIDGVDDSLNTDDSAGDVLTPVAAAQPEEGGAKTSEAPAAPASPSQAPAEVSAAAAPPSEAPAAEAAPEAKAEEPAPEPQGCELIFGSFEIEENAQAELEKAEKEGVKCRIVVIPVEKGNVYRVVSESFATVREAEDKKDYLNSIGFDTYIGE
ncbi:SPOR domain-containing protein [bacterium]|nr:SPOR domain-containing protein [bacterium]